MILYLIILYLYLYIYIYIILYYIKLYCITLYVYNHTMRAPLVVGCQTQLTIDISFPPTWTYG